MHDTGTLIDTRRCQTNKSHIKSNYYTLQPLTDNTAVNNSTRKNNENQNARFFPTDGQLRYHWCADDQIMTTINIRERCPETTELVNRRIELTKPGVMRPRGNRRFGRDIYVSQEGPKKTREER